MTTTTPNMSMVLPDDHGSAELWGLIVNAALTLNDGHDHTPGKGVKVPSAALNINADVSWSSGGTSRAITDLKAIDFFPSPTSGMTSLTGALFLNSADSELYYRTTAGVNVKITNGAALNIAAFAGGIGGDYSAVGALLSFDDATDSYWLQQQGAPRPWARVRTGDVDIYQTAASIVNRVRLQSPAALAASYALTLPAALPGAAAVVTIDAAGLVTAASPTTQALLFGAATTFSAAATFSSTINANSDVKHTSTRTLPLHASLFRGASGSFGAYGSQTSGAPSSHSFLGFRVTTAGTSAIHCPVDGLRVGDRISTVEIDAISATGTMGTFTIQLNTAALGANDATRASNASAGGVSVPELTQVATANFTLGAGDTPYIAVITNDTNLSVIAARVNWTRP